MRRIALALVGALVALTLATPSHATLNLCAAGKMACVAKKAAGILKCRSRNEKPPGLLPATFALCLQRVKDKFDGGTNPAKGCFAKLEGKGGCLTTSDTAALEAKVDAFADDVVCELDAGSGTCPATPTPTPTATLTPTPTSTPTPTATPTPVPCTGAVVGGFCWYLGADADSCDATCAAAGQIYDAATETYAGSSGTDANCVAVLDAIGAPAATFVSPTSPCTVGVGCGYLITPSTRIRCGAPPTTSSDGGSPLQRACACQ
jgi:hypothetical protein